MIKLNKLYTGCLSTCALLTSRTQMPDLSRKSAILPTTKKKKKKNRLFGSNIHGTWYTGENELKKYLRQADLIMWN